MKSFRIPCRLLIIIALTLMAGLFGGVGVTSADFTTINWDTNAAPYPLATSEAHSVVVNGKIYSFGGFDPSFVPYRNAYVYDPVTNVWTRLADLRHGLTHGGFATDGTDIYIAGGYIENPTRTGQIFGTTEVWRYNIATDTYTAMPPLPAIRAAGQLAYVNGELHYIGGTNQARTIDVGDHYVLDIGAGATNWVTEPALPNPRHHMGRAVIGNLIYLIGGQHGHDAVLVPQSDVHVYDTVTNTWTQLASLPFGLNHVTSTSVVFGTRIIVMGGQRNHNQAINNVMAYDPVLNTWSQLTPLPTNRHSSIGAVINNILYLSSGANSTTTYRGLPVLTAALTLQMTPDTTSINAGGNVTFTITVTNSGAEALTGVAVTDANLAACARNIGNMAVGATQTYTCTANTVNVAFSHTATVTGTGVTATATASDTSSVTIIAAPLGTITVVKQATPESAQQFQFTGTGGLGSFMLVDDGSAAPAPVNAQINFQPAASQVPAGYSVDSGLAYGARAGGQTYGWITQASVGTGSPVVIDISANTRDRLDHSPDQRLDTIIHMQHTNPATGNTTPAAWEYALPNGTYSVTVSVGDQAPYDSTHRITVENVLAINNYVGTAAQEYNSATVTVVVADGRLTIHAAGGGVNTKINYVQISGTPAPANTRIFGGVAAGTYNITETLPGGWTLSNATCTGGTGTPIANGLAVQMVGAANITCTFNNAASVTPNPLIALDATPATQTITSGTTANFTFTVTNPGNVNLTGITFSGITCSTGPTRTSGDTNANNTLEPTETWVYSCTVNNVTAAINATVTVSGTPPTGPAVTANDTVAVTVTAAPNPLIALDATPATQTIVSGTAANFTFTVTNPGNVNLTGIAFSGITCSAVPTLTGGDTNSNTALDPGETWVYSCTINNVTAAINATVTVSGTPPTGPAVTATDTVAVTVTAAPNPAIGLDATPDTQTVIPGGTANFTLTVNNSGNVALTNITFPGLVCTPGPTLTGGDTNTNNALDMTEIWTFSCAAANITAAGSGPITVSGMPPTGPAVTASDTVTIVLATAAITLDATPAMQTVNSGDTATYTFTVTNPAIVPLTGITFPGLTCTTGPTLTGGDTNTNNTLEQGETWTYTCDFANVTASGSGTVTVSGNPPVGPAVTASDTIAVTVFTPQSISITIGPAAQSLNNGDTATFTITIGNDGTLDLQNIVVSAPNAPDCARTFTNLVVGQIETYTCTVTNIGSSFSNTLTVTASSVAGGLTATNTASANVTLNQPAGSSLPAQTANNPGSTFEAWDPFVTKSANPPFALPGEAVTFTFVVRNPGGTVAHDVVAVDPMPAEVNILSATATSGSAVVDNQARTVTFTQSTLQPGETVTVTIQTRVRGDVAVPFIFSNEVCVNSSNQGAERCATTTVLSVSALPSTGETPFVYRLLRMLLLGVAACVPMAAAGQMVMRRRRG